MARPDPRGGPLEGRRILVTRAEESGGALGTLLREAGATVLHGPTIAIEPPSDGAPLERAARALPSYKWVIFTSANAVEALLAVIEKAGGSAGSWAGVRVAAIGQATAAAAAARGVRVDRVGHRASAEGLIETLADETWAGVRVLLPRAEKARDLLPETLRSLGAEVEIVTAYRTVPGERGTGSVGGALESGGLDAVTFTSSSAVTNFLALFGPGEAARRVRAGGVVVACIGPITAGTAREAGLPVQVIAGTQSLRGLVEALSRHLAAGRDALSDE
jgi:uroporphyrinogen-III synthase